MQNSARTGWRLAWPCCSVQLCSAAADRLQGIQHNTLGTVWACNGLWIVRFRIMSSSYLIKNNLSSELPSKIHLIPICRHMLYVRTKYCQSRCVCITPPSLPLVPGAVLAAAAAAVWLHRPGHTPHQPHRGNLPGTCRHFSCSFHIFFSFHCIVFS